MKGLPIYMDYNSTTPVDPRVLEYMLPYFTEKFGNPSSSTHLYGWQAKEAVETAREQVAALLNVTSDEVIFTSGATEGVNMMLKGVAQRYRSKGNHIITVASEHKAVLDTCKQLEESGCEVTYLTVNREGLIDLQELEAAFRKETILVSAMYANNETGVIQPMRKIGELCSDKQVLFMSDATQAVGKIRVDAQEEGIDILCCSSHKLYGPKGIGAVYMRRRDPRVSVLPLIHGGGHEKGLRSGTLNVPAIAGFGKACEIAAAEIWDDAVRISALRTKLEQPITDHHNVFINGSVKDRLPNTSNICFGNITSEKFIREMKNVAIATGSACTSAVMEPSHVLKSMGLSDEQAYASIRFSLGKYTTAEEVNKVIEDIERLFSLR